MWIIVKNFVKENLTWFQFAAAISNVHPIVYDLLKTIDEPVILYDLKECQIKMK